MYALIADDESAVTVLTTVCPSPPSPTDDKSGTAERGYEQKVVQSINGIYFNNYNKVEEYENYIIYNFI